MAELELPRMVHKADGVKRTVRTQAELDAALADGWSLHRVDGPDDAPVTATVEQVLEPLTPEEEKAMVCEHEEKRDAHAAEVDRVQAAIAGLQSERATAAAALARELAWLTGHATLVAAREAAIQQERALADQYEADKARLEAKYARVHSARAVVIPAVPGLTAPLDTTTPASRAADVKEGRAADERAAAARTAEAKAKARSSRR
jgi:hypothetical protein